MGTFSLPSSKEIKGPWFLNIKELEDLDEVLNEIDFNLEKSYNNLIEYQAQEELKKGKYETLEEASAFAKRVYSKNKKREFVVISNDQSKLQDSSIKKLLIDPKIKNFKPEEIDIEISYGYENKFTLTLRRRFDGDLKYKIECFSEEAKHKINYLIENWVEENKPSKSKQLWHNWSVLIQMIFGILFVIFAISIYNSRLPTTKELLQDEINNILKSGINENNRDKAIDLLLKINTNFLPENTEKIVQIDPLAIKLSIICLFFFIIGVIKPKTTIGIGKHKSSLKFYKNYSNFVLVTIPAVIVIPWLIDLLKSFF